MADKLKEIERAAEQKIGATGQFPEGKLDESDEGEIRIAIGRKDGKVVIDFGTPVKWIGFTPKLARQLAELIRQQSYKAEGK